MRDLRKPRRLTRDACSSSQSASDDDVGRYLYEVRQTRIAWQDSMEVRFIDTIERLTHRTVKAFLSANRQDAELTIELFVLEPDTTPA